MLTEEKLVAFVWTADPGRAQAFYEGVLGLSVAEDNDHLLTFDSGPARIALVKSTEPVTPPRGTAVGWNVRDVTASVRELLARGVAFERSASNTDQLPIWSPTPGYGVAWFLDPDGNRLSVSGPT